MVCIYNTVGGYFRDLLVYLKFYKFVILNVDGEGCQLSWTRRMKIVIGIAKGLKYLHTEIEPPFTISQLNSSAVYLTEDFLPKVSEKRYSLTFSFLFNLVWGGL